MKFLFLWFAIFNAVQSVVELTGSNIYISAVNRTNRVSCKTYVNLCVYFLAIVFGSEWWKDQITVGQDLQTNEKHRVFVRGSKFLRLMLIMYVMQCRTCRNPGTSPTAVPSARIQIMSGCGFPLAWHSITAPVPFEKSTRFGGSLTKMGPMVSSSADTAVKSNFISRCKYTLLKFSFLNLSRLV